MGGSNPGARHPIHFYRGKVKEGVLLSVGRAVYFAGEGVSHDLDVSECGSECSSRGRRP